MNLLVVGASYRTADVALLERLSVPAHGRAEVLAALLAREHVSEAVVLSTCNRVEVYAGVTGFHGGLADVSAGLAERAGVAPAALASNLYVHWDAEAVTHTLRVAAGLDSLVVGESQIVGQLREAYATATEADTAGRLLHELMQQALRVGKRARAETGIDAAGRSMVTAALDLAVTHLEPDGLRDRPTLVVGAGSMGALALATLSRAGAGPLTVTSRRRERAARLADSYQARVVESGQLATAMAEVDLVVSATASSAPVLGLAEVSHALAARPPGRPLVICDLAVPRDVEPAVADLPGVVLIDVARLAAATPHQAAADVHAVEEIVATEAATVTGALKDARVGPTVAALRARADEVVAAELRRLAQRRPDLTDELRAEVAHTLHRLVQRLLHQPTVRVRQLAAAPGGEAYAAALVELFDLEVPRPQRADDVPSRESGGGET